MTTVHRLAVTLIGVLVAAPLSAQDREPITALTGATLIDGNGGPPLADATVVVTGKRISAVGRRAQARVPRGARVIDATGKFLTPGFIDTNVHLSLYGAGETFVRYEEQNADLTLESAQLHLKHGVTTVRDSYGSLVPLVEVRDRINRGEVIGPRMLVAGNIVGWGGPCGTGHFSHPSLIGFSPDQQRVIVEEVHRRGKVAETHSTSPEGLRLSILAGMDLIQHPEVLPDTILDELIRMIRDRNIGCAILSNTITGKVWQKHLKDKEERERKKAETEKAQEGQKGQERQETSAEIRKERRDQNVGIEVRRVNAQRLIQGGCTVTIATDNYPGQAPEFRREPKPEHQEMGIGTVIAIEGLVELGMTPGQAIVSATKNGAFACRSDQYGTVEVGRLADLLLLDADPLADISNIRKLALAMKEGSVVGREKLPERPVWYQPGR